VLAQHRTRFLDLTPVIAQDAAVGGCRKPSHQRVLCFFVNASLSVGRCYYGGMSVRRYLTWITPQLAAIAMFACGLELSNSSAGDAGVLTMPTADRDSGIADATNNADTGAPATDTGAPAMDAAPGDTGETCPGTELVDGFDTQSDWKLLGVAAFESLATTPAVTLTNESNNERGGVFFNDSANSAMGFVATATLHWINDATNPDLADGFALIWTSDTPTLAGGGGSRLGACGSGKRGYAVMVNVDRKADAGVPPAKISVVNLADCALVGAVETVVLSLPGDHAISVRYTPPALTVSIGGNSLTRNVADLGTSVRFGITAATGARNNKHAVSDFALSVCP
jgi:hypothetical protein